MKTWVGVILLVLQLTRTFGAEEKASDGTVAAQPFSVVPAPPGANSSPSRPPNSLNEVDNSGGTTTETKYPDGSTTRITHFRGQVPPNAFPQFPQYNPYFAYSALPPYFYPVVPPRGYPQSPNGQPFNQPGNGQPFNQPGNGQQFNQPGNRQPFNQPGNVQPLPQPGNVQPLPQPGIVQPLPQASEVEPSVVDPAKPN